MIKAIKEKYCKNNLVQLMSHSDVCQLIVNANEIILLKTNEQVLINKYTNHPSRSLFPYHEKEIHYLYGEEKYTELFEYDKIYLGFTSSIQGYSLFKKYFFKGSNRALLYKESLPIDERIVTTNKKILTREETEEIFNNNNYDSIYVLNKNGSILYASNKKDGCIIDKKIIPSDEEIIEIDLSKRIFNHKITTIFQKINGFEEENEIIQARDIEEIKNLDIYETFSVVSHFSHILITSKNGTFQVNWFSLKFLSKDRFQLEVQNIPVIMPTIDDLISYTKNNSINYTEEPYDEYNTEDVISKIKLSEDKSIKIDSRLLTNRYI